MDELDNDARQLIRQACAEERRPSARARRRVQRGVALAVPTVAVLGTSTHGAGALTLASSGVATGAGKALSSFGILGTLGMKTWFVCGVTCGIGLTASGFGAWAHRSSLVQLFAPASKDSATAVGGNGSLPAPERPAPSVTVSSPQVVSEPVVSAAGPEAMVRPMASARVRQVNHTAGSNVPTVSTGLAPTLVAEVRMLTEAQTLLRNGQPRAALDSLRQYDGRFGASPLRPDVEAVRLLSVCELGRVVDAQAAVDAFVTAYPGSPHEPRIRNACGLLMGKPKSDSSAPQGQQGNGLVQEAPLTR